jgi:transforming growth factor-beta-induced protein
MPTIIDTMLKDGRFGNLVAAMQRVHLDKYLNHTADMTVFAPTDDAFALLPELPAEQLYASDDHLRDVLNHHIVEGSITATDLPGLKNLKTVDGTELPVLVDGGRLYIGGAEIEHTDICTDNGVIHIIDRVLLPPE